MVGGQGYGGTLPGGGGGRPSAGSAGKGGRGGLALYRVARGVALFGAWCLVPGASPGTQSPEAPPDRDALHVQAVGKLPLDPGSDNYTYLQQHGAEAPKRRSAEAPKRRSAEAIQGDKKPGELRSWPG